MLYGRENVAGMIKTLQVLILIFLENALRPDDIYSPKH